MKKKLGLVIAEVCPLLQQGISEMLTRTTSIKLLGTAQNVDEAVQLCQLYQADVLLLQWSTDCVDKLALLQRESPTTKVLILIPCSNAAYNWKYISEVPQILAAGAWGIVSIDDSLAIIIAAIHAIAQNQRWTSSHLTLPPISSGKPTVQPVVFLLKTREQEVLELIVRGKTDKEIARALNIGERTVRDRLGSIYDKLKVDSRIEAAAEAVRRGLVS